ncbi:hypothetical protein VCUG_00600 [Vavraia culicis subsp. floridensis]|uniref:Mechanosensitive ion channel MscS domain-containing protein n=1 Tax=Vavraia culicis (isolate floridensis) TaxID=948595 RepID=L2GXS2_VAVCU|nr:uncharacterized protein VCUG_00600 [Vavraia culicis subsp. floridensis]ELA47880.1 hypothetical protein VCUG_00600 [Vavraia culicis subsp. floridensis]
MPSYKDKEAEKRNGDDDESESNHSAISVNIRYSDQSDDAREHDSTSNDEDRPSRNRLSNRDYSIINRDENEEDEGNEYYERNNVINLENDTSTYHSYDARERRSLHDSDSTLTKDSDYNALEKESQSRISRFFTRMFVFFDRVLEVDFFYFFLGSVLILIVALCIPSGYLYTCFQKEEGSDTFKEHVFKLRMVFLCIAGILFVIGCIASFIYHVAQILLKYLGEQDGWFATFASLNCHLAMMIALVTLLVTFTYKRMTNLQFAKGTNLDISHVLSTLLFANFLLTLKTFILKKVSFTFNFSNYLNRIRLVLLDEYFKSFLKGLKDLDSIEGSKNDSYWKNFLPSGKSMSQEKAIQVFDKFFVNDIKGKDIEKVLLSEFSKLYARQLDPFKRDQILKKFWLKRSKKIYSASTAINTFSTINDFAGLFANRELFERFCKLLKIKPRDVYNERMIYALLERRDTEHYFLSRSFEQNNAALNRVGYTLSVVIAFVALSIFLGIFLNKTDATIDIISALFGTGFILNSTIKEAISSTVFVFCVKPYDIGDRVFIFIDNELENLVVTELNVLSTTFCRFDGIYVVIPNIVLANKAITNVRRSSIMSEAHVIQVSSDTPIHKIELLKYNIKAFLHLNRNYYTEFFMLNYDHIEDSNKLFIRIYMQYDDNWQDYEAFLEKKTFFLCFLNKTVNDLGITYVPLTQRVNLVRENGKIKQSARTDVS